MTVTRGKEYIVVGIEGDFYRVLNDYNEPSLVEKEYVDVLDPEVPKDWISIEDEDGEIYADPPGLGGPGFYEDYFDDKEYAIDRFQAYIDSIGLNIQARPYHPPQIDPKDV
ncbi:hypothetical protein K2Y11_07655 [bacterium]|nr:hypothetical protein [bacterium]